MSCFFSFSIIAIGHNDLLSIRKSFDYNDNVCAIVTIRLVLYNEHLRHIKYENEYECLKAH